MKYAFVPYKPNSKVDCQYCKGRKTWTLLYDTETNDILPSDFGKCDRINNCPTNGRAIYPKSPMPVYDSEKVTPYTPPPQKFVDFELVKRTMTAYHNNNFVKGLLKIANSIAVKDIIEKSYIGTTKDGGTIFWLVNNGQVYNGKVLHYNEDLKRIKDINPRYLFKRDDGYYCTLFGLEQLNLAKDNVIVESEKTAILGRIFRPNVNWIAVGGSNGMTLDKCKELKNTNHRKTNYVFYDCDLAGRKGSFSAKANMESFELTAVIHDLDSERNDGYDIGDKILEDLELLPF